MAVLCQYNDANSRVVNGPNMQKIHAQLKKVSIEYAACQSSAMRLVEQGKLKIRGTGQFKKFVTNLE